MFHNLKQLWEENGYLDSRTYILWFYSSHKFVLPSHFRTETMGLAQSLNYAGFILLHLLVWSLSNSSSIFFAHPGRKWTRFEKYGLGVFNYTDFHFMSTENTDVFSKYRLIFLYDQITLAHFYNSQSYSNHSNTYHRHQLIIIGFQTCGNCFQFSLFSIIVFLSLFKCLPTHANFVGSCIEFHRHVYTINVNRLCPAMGSHLNVVAGLEAWSVALSSLAACPPL